MLYISDTSVISALISIGEVHLLPGLFGTVTITESVYHECTAPNAPPAMRAVVTARPKWLIILDDPKTIHPSVVHLGAGERTSISLAVLHRDESIVAIDERRGRIAATKLGVKITGLVAILGNASLKNLTDFDDSIRKLKETDFRVSEAVIETISSSLKRRKPS